MFARIRKHLEENEEGFTLIELLVVIIIIGILAAIAIPVFLNQRTKGYQASEKSDLHTVANELETYFTDNQTYDYKGAGATAGTALVAPSATIGADTVSLSNGNTITIEQAGSSGYCLFSTSSHDSSGKGYTYDSLKGGLQPGSASTNQCGTSGY